MSSGQGARWFQAIILMIFVGLSYSSFSLVHKIAQSRSKETFQGLVDQSLISLDRRFEDYSRILDGVAGLVMASDEVTAADMSNYTKALNLDQGMSVLDAIGLAAPAPVENGQPGRTFTPTDGDNSFSPERSTLKADDFIVQYIEPLASHEMLLRLDFASNSDLLAAAKEARDTGQTLLSRQSPDVVSQIGYSQTFLLKPIYKPSQGTYLMKPQEGQFLGFAFAVLNFENTFSNLTTAQDKLLELQVKFNDKIVYETNFSNPTIDTDVSDYIHRQSFQRFGRAFSLSWNSTMRFDAIQPFRASWIVLSLGILITALVGAILQVLIKRNLTISATVAQKTQELETQNHEKRSILENTMLAILSVDKSGKILDANVAARKLLLPLSGQMRLSNMFLSDLLPDVNLLGVDGWSKLHMTSRIQNAEPSVIEIEKKTWFTAGGEPRTTFLMRDITVTESHAQKIVEAEQRWNLALTSAQIGVFDIDLRDNSSVVSDTWLENMQIEALPGSKNPYREQMVRMHPDDLVLFQKAETTCIEGGSDRAVARFRIKVDNDEWRWIKSDAVVVERAACGTALRILGIQMDVTESFRLERMKRDFVSTVSHELRTPLTSIKGALGLLQAQLQAKKLNGADRLIDIASSNSDRLVSLVNDILDMEKMNSGNMHLNMKTVSLNEILNEVSQQVETYASQWNVDLEVVEPEVEISISTDKKRIIQVLTNLLSNACKFAYSQTTVRLTTQVLPNHIKILVSNFGPGIPEGFRGKIFQPFSQADSSTTRQRGGTGLGLSISRTLIESMGGSIGFESQPDQETIFWFTCPSE